jgi:predicted RNase H-like HicB family nuclease
MKQEHEYEAVLARQLEGGFTVSVPDLPDIVTEGETHEQALEMARDAIEGYLETVQELGFDPRHGERTYVVVRPA